jgi:hypothetical protein
MTTDAEYDALQKMSTAYEWDIETVGDGEIQDHDHRDKLKDFYDGQLKACELYHDNGFTGTTLVLVKDVGSEANGLMHRAWAYTERVDGKLVFVEQHMDDGKAIPKRFIEELERNQ